jgi:hypothetical protein
MQRILLVGLVLAGCAPDYAGLEVEIESDLSGDGRVSDAQIQLTLGSAVMIRARPRSANHLTFDEPNEAELRPVHDDLMRVYPAEEDWRWILVARGEGKTCLEVVVSGIREDCIDTRVVGQGI